MLGYRFLQYSPDPSDEKSSFDKLWEVFKQLLLITSGDVKEALGWLNNLDLDHKPLNPALITGADQKTRSNRRICAGL